MSKTRRETLAYDAVIVGAGPAGLAAALYLAARARLRVCVLEKAARVGGHSISGALIDPADLAPLQPLMPDGADPQPPLGPPVSRESLRLLRPRGSLPLPIPRAWRRGHCRLVSLGALGRWLAAAAEAAGVDIFPGFAAVAPLMDGDRVAGVITGDLGRDRAGRERPGFQPGVAIAAPLTLVAEGCRGSLAGALIRRFGLAANRPPPTYALGFKELWETPPADGQGESLPPPPDRDSSNSGFHGTGAGGAGSLGLPGAVLHTLGWPLPGSVHGGGFLYRFDERRAAVGFVTALHYRDPRLDPFERFQAWKTHPDIRRLLTGGRPIAYGARTIATGGWSSLPELAFDGGLLIGDAAGFLDAARLQGIGNAITSGLLAGQAAAAAFAAGDFSRQGLGQGSGRGSGGFARLVADSPMGARLRAVRNVGPGFRAGRLIGSINAAWEGTSGGRSPWSLSWSESDRRRLRPLAPSAPPSTSPSSQPEPRPEPNRPTASRSAPGASDQPAWRASDQPAPARARSTLRFDRPTLLGLAGLRHEPDQPDHLQRDRIPEADPFDYPETRYCPSQVYQRTGDAGAEPAIRTRSGDCLHCKCCDIKDPHDAIRWTPPEGGSGPDYGGL